MNTEQIKEFGECRIGGIEIITIIGEIEGHEGSSGLKTPTASFIIGDSHSIGVPLAVATDFSCIVPSATMILHPVRMSGMILGAPQSYDQFEKIQARIVDFIVRKRGLTKTHVEELMMNTSMFAKDLGTLLVGGQAVEEGLVDKVGTLSDVMDYLKQCPH